LSERWVVGIDIGGTNLVVGVVPFEGGAPRAQRIEMTRPARGGDAIVADVVRMAREAVAELRADCPGAEVVGVGIGCPGPLDLERGLVRTSPNLGWKDFPIRDGIADGLGLPASLDNDANCATFGEWWQGAGRDVATLIGVTLGTGIGGGIVLDGKVLRGASGCAGELGHTTIDFTGRRCACGNYGCLEAYASGPNIAARAREGVEAGDESILAELVGGDLDQITAKTVYDALLAGDAFAKEIMQETAKVLGAGIANVVNLFNPQMVVVVGGVTRAGDHLFGPLRSEVRRRAFDEAVEACRIVPGELIETAGVIGAAGIFVTEHGR